MRFYEIKITSKHYDLHFQSELLATTESEAKGMAGDHFHELVQGFMDGPVRHPNKNPTIINKIALLRDALFEIVVNDTPTILTANWDKTK